MIVEIFGPASAGKTTLAADVAAALAAAGQPVRLRRSARPAETNGHKVVSRVAAPLTRLTKALTGLSALTAAGSASAVSQGVFGLLPPSGALWNLRYRMYLSVLQGDWTRARQEDDAVHIFDQGYMTAVCSLAILANDVAQQRLEAALAVAPKPDLLVRLKVPPEVMEARLKARLAHQGPLERMLELDLGRTMSQIRIANDIAHTLRGTVPSITLTSVNDRERALAVRAVVSKVMARVRERGSLPDCLSLTPGDPLDEEKTHVA